MINLGIIGLGTIFAWQQQALVKLSEKYKIHAVYDIKLDHAIKLVEKTNIKVYENLSEFLRDDKIDAIVIITPPHTHADIANQCLRAGKHVLLEKPAVLHMKDLTTLYNLAKEKQLLFKVAYHSSFAIDIEWYLKNITFLNEKYHLGKLCKIECGFYDPYTQNNLVMPEKYVLCGSFIDSAVNALSVCARLTDLKDMNLISKTEHREPSNSLSAEGIVYEADAKYSNGECDIIIHTAWNLGLNQKTTELSFEDTNKTILLHHSQQCVFLKENNNLEILFKENEQERLLNHYLGVYSDFANAYDLFTGSFTEQPAEQITYNIHRLLLC